MEFDMMPAAARMDGGSRAASPAGAGW